MKKQHDARSLASELEGSSAFFQTPQPASPEAAPLPSQARPPARTHPGPQPPAVSDRSSDRSPDRTSAQPAGRPAPKRQTQRRAFEFYRDQLETFKRWSALDITEGGEGNMSVWAREAFDDYIAKRDGDDRTRERPAGRSTDRWSGEEGRS